MTKVCSKCLVEKQLNEFSLDRGKIRNNCKKCAYVSTLNWRNKNRDKLAIQRKKYKIKHKEKLTPKDRIRNNRLYHKNYRFKRIEKIYGLNKNQLEALRQKQNNVCAICYRVDVKKDLCVDHNHKTGAVRGLLCQRCNTAIGLLGDSPETLQGAIDYLNNQQEIIKFLESYL